MNARRTSAAGVATVPAAKSTITLRRRGVLAVAGTAVIAAASLGATATAYAKKGDDDARKDVRKSVACGTGGQLKLKVKSESPKLMEVEAEVDSNKAGQEWTVTLTNDGKVVWTGKRITAGPSGSFSVETTIDPDAPAATPTETPTSSTTTSSSTTTTTSSSTTTTTTATPSTSEDSSSTATASPTTTATTPDDSGHDKGDDHPSVRAAGSKGADDKKADDKGGDTKGKPATGKHLIGVTATLDTLTCATELTY